MHLILIFLTVPSTMKSFTILSNLAFSLATTILAKDKIQISKCIDNPEFILQDIKYYSYLVYSTPAHLAVSEGFINFTLTNTADRSDVFCNGEGGTPFTFFNGDLIYHCSTSHGYPSFRYTFPSNLFQVNTTWSCWERPLDIS
jgi:hypothetical protein